MNRFNKLTNRLTFIAVLLLGLALTSCDKEPKPTPQTGSERILFSTSIMNADGASGNGYLQAIGSIEAKKYDNSRGVPVGFGTEPIYCGDHLYVLPDYMGMGKAELVYYTVSKELQFTKRGAMELPGGAAACNVVEVSPEKAYISFQNIGQVWAFNPKTMTKTAVIDLNQYKHDDTNVIPGAMAVRDGKLYVGLCQMDSKWMPLHKEVELALIDIATDKVEKKISSTTSGLSVATRPIVANSIFLDDKGDLYILCMGSFGFNPEFPGGIVRIKKGETEIDPSWSMNLSEINIEVKGVLPQTTKLPANYIGSMRYVSGSKAVAIMGIYALDPTSKNPYTALYCIPTVIDLEQRTIQQIEGIPVSNPHAVALGRYNDQIMIGSAGKERSGFYSYDPKTGAVSDGPVFEVEGNPVSFYHMK